MTTEAEVYSALKYRVDVDQFGTRRYYNQNGKLHRENGPAVLWADGTTMWYQNGLRHRTNGPAVILANGIKLWYLENVQYSRAQHRAKVKNADNV